MNGCRIVYYCELTESDDEKDCESYVEVEDGRCEYCDYNTGACNSEEARHDKIKMIQRIIALMSI